MRNGADVLLKSLFTVAGGRAGLTLFAVVLLGSGLWLVLKDIRARGRPRLPVFGLMLGESALYGVLLGSVVGVLTQAVLHPGLVTMAAQGGSVARLDLPTQVMISLGAGLYEELLFRVVLVGLLATFARRVLAWGPVGSGVAAVVVGALAFSAFHYVGPYGDPFALGSFTFRTIAGAVFSALYLLRGFGVTAWTHALYDVFLAFGF